MINHLNNFQINNQTRQLSSIFKTLKKYNVNELEFIKSFINSKDFKLMMENYSYPYWDNSPNYVIGDYLNKTNIIKNKSNVNISEVELTYLSRMILQLVYKYNINIRDISNKLNMIIKFTDYIDYHSPEEIIQKCNLIKSSEIKSQYK